MPEPEMWLFSCGALQTLNTSAKCFWGSLFHGEATWPLEKYNAEWEAGEKDRERQLCSFRTHRLLLRLISQPRWASKVQGLSVSGALNAYTFPQCYLLSSSQQPQPCLGKARPWRPRGLCLVCSKDMLDFGKDGGNLFARLRKVFYLGVGRKEVLAP